MPLETKTREELEAIGRGAMGAYIDGADTSRGGDLDISVKMNVALALGAQASAKHGSLQIFPATADDDFILLHAAERGATKQPAALAHGRALIIGEAGSTATQPVSSVLTAADGLSYITTSSVTMATPAWSGRTAMDGSTPTRLLVKPNVIGMAIGDVFEIDGATRSIKDIISSIDAIDVDGPPLTGAYGAGEGIFPAAGAVVGIQSLTPGSSTNKEPQDELTLAAPTATITADTLIYDLSGGGDEETTGELGRRLTAHYAAPPGGGNAAQIREVARTTPLVRLDDACVYLGYRGFGTVDVIPIGVTGARRVGQVVCDMVQDNLDAVFGSQYDIKVLPFEYSGDESQVSVAVVATRGGGPDFDGTFAIAAGSTTTKIDLASDPRTTVEVGDRIIVQLKPGWRWRTYQRRVNAIVYDGTHWTFEVDALPIAPVVGDPDINAGFAAAEATIAAIEAMYDSLGPGLRSFEDEDFIQYEREPTPDLAWSDQIRTGALSNAILSIPGVIDLGVTAPFLVSRSQPQEVIRPGKITVTAVED